MKLAYEPRESALTPIPLPGRAPDTSGILRAADRFAGAVNIYEAKLAAEEEKLANAKRHTDLVASMGELDTEIVDAAEKIINTNEGGKIQAGKLEAFGQDRVKARADSVTDPLLKEAILAAGTLAVGKAAQNFRGRANLRIAEATQASALAQLDALRAKGTPEALQEANELTAGLTEATIFSAEFGATQIEKNKSQSLSNALGRDLDADATGTLDRLLKREGMYSPQYMDDATWQRAVGSVRQKIEHEKKQGRDDILWAEHVQAREDKEAEKVRKDVASVFKADFAVMAAVDPAAANRFVDSMGPNSEMDVFTGEEVLALRSHSVTIFNAAQETTINPVEQARVIEDWAKAPASRSLDTITLSTMPGLGRAFRLQMIGAYKDDANRELEQKKDETQRIRVLHHEEQRTALAILGGYMDDARASGDQGLLRKTSTIHNTHAAVILGMKPGGAETPTAYLEKRRGEIEAQVGQAADSSVRVAMAVMPMGVTDKDTLWAYMVMNGIAAESKEGSRLIRALRNVGEITEKAAGMKAMAEQKKRLSADVAAGKKLQEAGKPPGSIDINDYNALAGGWVR